MLVFVHFILFNVKLMPVNIFIIVTGLRLRSYMHIDEQRQAIDLAQPKTVI